jgi:hypothetical protein
MEPARSDEIPRAPGADGDDRAGWRQNPQPTSAYPARALWPWTFPTGSRPVPVVGPTETLRGRVSGPGLAVPSGAVQGVLDPAQRSSWQLAQEVWQESGVTWERTAPELADVEPAAGWLPDGEPARVARLTYAPPPADLADPEPAYFEPACFEPFDPDPEPGPGPEPAAAWLADPDREDQESGGFQASTASAWADYADLADGDREDPQSADYERATRDAWPGPAWDEYPADGFPGQAWPAGVGRVPLGAPVALDQAPESVNLTERFSAAEPDGGTPGWAGGTSFSEPDELFRAWQGSVNEAAAARGPWSVPRRAASASRRRRALQAAAIGVPVVVIVTVGAGALMMLTGKANDMLAVRADTGAASPAATATGTSGTHVARPTAGGVPPAFVRAALSGYPGQRGTVTVASMMAAAGVTVAVGTADGHPAIWRRASNGSWTLESPASLSAATGSAGLASVTDGPAGWIAVGTTSDGRSTEPVVFASADGVQWQPVTSLTAQAGSGTEFLGAAANRSGYVVVGRQMVGGRTFAVLWYSADLRSWTSDFNDGLDGRLAASTANAITATADGFVAVGSHGADQSMWVSPDGQHWSLDSVSLPAGAASATLSSVVASGANVVAGGYAATRAGDIPVVVVSADGGGQWRQVMLQAPDGLGVVTALTATPAGFTAAGVVGRGGAQHAVTWTSPDGLTWSSPAQAAGTEITALALTGGTVAGTAEQGDTPTLVPLPAP